jgi:hypothetical protein
MGQLRAFHGDFIWLGHGRHTCRFGRKGISKYFAHLRVACSNVMCTGLTVHEQSLQKSIRTPGRGLAFVHYAGHAEEINGDLILLRGEKRIPVQSSFFNNVADEYSLYPEAALDVIFFAARTIPPVGRVVEMLATSHQTPIANPGSERALFTSEFSK